MAFNKVFTRDLSLTSYSYHSEKVRTSLTTIEAERAKHFASFSVVKREIQFRSRNNLKIVDNKKVKKRLFDL